ncbi:MAG: GntR family transcriptional regulator [Candidatus Pacebacteria bacterium]|nr:GntR family transcriptional regulator [Candidatus Paceibacterota bacterium]
MSKPQLRGGESSHAQIERHVRKMLQDGELAPGHKLPPTSALVKSWKVSPHSIHRAFASLVEMGYPKRKPRGGTFVPDRAAAITNNVGFYYFHDRQPLTLATVEAMHRMLAPNHVDIKVIPFERGFFAETDFLDDARRRDLETLLVTVLDTPDCLRAMKELEAAGFPHLRFINRDFDDQLHSPLLTENDEVAMEESIRLLRSRGHEAIGYIGHPSALGREVEAGSERISRSMSRLPTTQKGDCRNAA